MALFFDAPVENDALTAFVRDVPFNAENQLLALFGRNDVETNTVDFAEIVRTNRTARYRSFDGRIHVSARDTGSEKRVPLLPLSSSLNEGEYERLQLQFAALQGGNQARLARSVYNDAEQLTSEVNNRLEMAWGDVLSDGVLTISEGGLTGSAGVADFGVPANQKSTVATSWATIATAPALSDIQGVLDIRVTNGNPAPGYLLTSALQIRNLRRNKQIIDAVFGSTAGKTQVSLTELRNILADEFNVTLLNAYDSAFDVDGVTTRSIPDDKVMFLPPNLDDLGYTAWGVSATALELVNSNRVDFSFEEAPGIVGVVVKEGPPFRQFVFVDGVAMPVITGARTLSVLDVVP